MKRVGILTRLKKGLGANGPGVTVAVIALVVALTGGAFAASQQQARTNKKSKNTSLSSKQKTEVKNIAKQFAGKEGPSGPSGAPGAKGDKGDAGAPGAAGKDGTSVTAEAYSGPECEEGGIEVSSASGVVYVCNGKEGEEGAEGPQGDQGLQGKEGSPWTAGGTLPPGSTETGTWSATTPGEGNVTAAPLVFSIPLAAAITAAHTYIQDVTAGFEQECPEASTPNGSVENPKAKPGVLCVYVGEQEKATAPAIWRPGFSSEGAARSGAIITFGKIESGGRAFGSYAVTGCTKVVGQPFQCP